MRSGSLTAVVAILIALAGAPGARAGEDPAKAVGKAVELGVPTAASVSWTELVVEVPVRVKPGGVGGRIEAVRFTDLAINGIPFEVDPYAASFELPEKEPVTLAEPLRLRVRFARVAPGVLEEALMPSDSLHLTGKVAVDGTFRKWIFSAKRSVVAPIDISRRNPIAEYHPLKLALAEMREWERRGWRLPF